MSTINNRIVVVTGAGTGIGRGIALSFAQEGAKVALIGRRIEKLKESSEAMPHGSSLVCPCDVSDREAVNETMSRIALELGSVDVLVNNAGVNTNPRNIGDVSPEDWDKTIAVNLTGVFNCTKAVLPGMREKQDGLIINISSIAGIRTSELAGAAYSAAKHGVVSLSYTINQEEGEHGIRGCTICPGEVDTPIMDGRPVVPDAQQRKRMLKPEDIGAAAVFVARLPARATVPLMVVNPAVNKFG